jgi:integrase
VTSNLAPSLSIVPKGRSAEQRAFWDVVSLTLKTVAPSSAKVYEGVYNRWEAWCLEMNEPLLPILPMLAGEFLLSAEVAVTTRSNYLAALRKLAKMLSMDVRHPEWLSYYKMLCEMRAPKEGAKASDRRKGVLKPSQVEKVLEFWKGNDGFSLRNAAIIALALSTGVRRAEVVALRWHDIDLNEGIVHIPHPKGDKGEYQAAIVDDFLNAPLIRWAQYQVATMGSCHYVFTPLDKTGKIIADRPITGDTFYKVVRQTEQGVNVKLTPHTFRRTLGTELVAQGASISDVQAQLNHADPSTTLKHYVYPAEARQRRRRLKTSWNPN